MRDELRDRFFTPFVLPLTVIGVMLLIGVSLARILLAVSEIGASLVALLAAGYVMAMAFFVEARRRIPPRTLGVALAIGLIGLVGAGAVANAAGVREVEHEEEGGATGEAGEGGGNPNEPLFVAVDIDFEQAPEALPPGDIAFTLDNQGSIEHNVTIEELGDEVILDAQGGATDEATVALEAGEYHYYCSVPGHESTMNGTLTIEEGVELGGGGGEGGSEAASEAGGASEGASDAPASSADSASEGASEAGSEAASEAGAAR